MSEQAREAVRRVAQLFPTAIISGRGREKVQQFVRLAELYYAGSHGMDIVGPQVGAGPWGGWRAGFLGSGQLGGTVSCRQFGRGRCDTTGVLGCWRHGLGGSEGAAGEGAWWGRGMARTPRSRATIVPRDQAAGGPCLPKR